MARLMDAEDTEVFRASIREYGVQWGRAYDYTDVRGPFRTVGAAKSAVTRAKRDAARRAARRRFLASDYPDEVSAVEAKVQRAALVWEDVPE